MKKDHKIAKFMGLEVVRIGYYGTDDETKWQVKNKHWLDKPEIIEQYDNSVGDYYVNIEKNIIIHQEYVDYKRNWNDLMPVVQSITPIAKKLGQQAWFDTQYSLLEADIQAVYKRVVEFIKWYNKQKP